MERTNKFVDFMNKHKREIIVGSVASVVGIVVGVVGYNLHISEKYGNLLKEVSKFDNDIYGTGDTMAQSVTSFLENAEKAVYPITPNVDKTIADMFNSDIVDLLLEHGIGSDTKCSGVLVGTKF